MHSILDPHLASIAEICRRHSVRRLELFGSAATAAFDPRRSDVDFLVEFDPGPTGLFKQYFGLKEALEAMLGRAVDLVMVGALRNPHFIAAANQTRQLVYASENAETA